MFSVHICSYKALLLNGRSTPMVDICCFSHCYCNHSLIMAHICSNYSISRTESITIFNACYLDNCEARNFFPSVLKQRYPFPDGFSFWSVLSVVLLCRHCSESYPNRTWGVGAVSQWFFSPGASKYWKSSPTVTFLSIIFVVCGLDTGWVWMISSTAYWIAYLLLEYFSADSDYLLHTSMFSLNPSWLSEVDEFSCEVFLVTPGRFLFCLSILCDQLIPLAMVGEKRYFVADFRIRGFKIENKEFDKYKNCFSVRPLLLKALYKYSFRICEHFEM